MSTPIVSEPLSTKARAFFEGLKSRISRLQSEIDVTLLMNVAFHFEVPKDFTAEEADAIGRELTTLRWNWEEMRRHQYGWKFILFPL